MPNTVSLSLFLRPIGSHKCNSITSRGCLTHFRSIPLAH
uniref:Uncharacterized protein n=1 Tax=Anguilla anguilla TaxID=7936 RepID=A0A0E9R2V3_ANGAN